MLNDKGSAFALCGIEKLAVGVLYHESIMDIKGTLERIILEDLSAQANYYPQLLSIEGEDTVSFTYRRYTPTFADYPGFKQFLRLKVSSVKVSLLLRFFFELSDYFAEMSEMKKALSETASLAVSKSQEADQLLTNEQKYQQKFRFEIMLNYLKLDIPKNSISPEYIQLNMGKISLSNNHFLIDPETFVIGERMSFLMSDACAAAGNALEPGKLIQIIDKIDLLMEWERSIDDEDHLVPGFRLSVDCPEINFRMTEKQYALWMNTIRQFITERSLQSQRRQILNGTDVYPPPRPNLEENKKGINPFEKLEAEYQKAYVTVAVALNFHGGSVEIVEESPDDPTEFHSQAIGELKEFAFVWISTSDGKSKMHFSFDDITVYDSRPKSVNQFSKLWSHEIHDEKPIFNFYYTNNGRGNGRIAFQFDRPRMVMLPLVYKVIKFFTNPYLCYELPPKLLRMINKD
jgi:hypothetical protein